MAQGNNVDHGGGIDAAVAQWGGNRADWLDLSTGINPVAWPASAQSVGAPPLPALPQDSWTALPDRAAFAALDQSARQLWQVPDAAQVVIAPGASALIARLPDIAPPGRVSIPAPTYNEHARAFRSAGRDVITDGTLGEIRVLVHPNNPDGRLWSAADIGGSLTVIDESFGEVSPAQSLIRHAGQDGVIILKSFGKFWGLAGLRLGFAIATERTLAGLARPLETLIGPWAVSGPALAIGTAALCDHDWIHATRQRLATDATRLDQLLQAKGAQVIGGCDLFRLYQVDDAALWQENLARHRILGRIFPYSNRWLRLGLPGPNDWSRLEAALT